MQSRRTVIGLVAGGAIAGFAGGRFYGGLPTCAAPASRMLRLEVVFGMGRTGAADIDEAEWRAFLDAEVTPRFPDGLTVLAATGQWRNPQGVLVKEAARVLLVWLPDEPAAEARIDAVRDAWKTRHRQESVMRVTGTSCVAF